MSEAREHEFYAEFVHCTDMAVLLRSDDEEIWIPRSVLAACDNDNDIDDDGWSGTVVVPQWFAEEKGLV